MNEDSTRNWLEIVQTDWDFNRNINYTNTKGESFVNTIGDIMAHVANHGTHHRAQIASAIRGEGFAPPATDLIFYIREL